jgi:hypothetical protein
MFLNGVLMGERLFGGDSILGFEKCDNLSKL